jgi:hypothetical protein
METKLNRNDKCLISFISLVLAVFTCFYWTSNLLYSSSSGFAGKMVYFFLGSPVAIFISLAHFPQGDYRIIAFIVVLVLLSPIISFIFWFLMFYSSARLIKELSKTNNLFLTNSVPIIVGIVFLVSLAFSIKEKLIPVFVNFLLSLLFFHCPQYASLKNF